MKNIYYLRSRIKTDPEFASKTAATLNFTLTELNRKLARPRRLKLGEVMVLKRIFRLTTEETIFIFAPSVAYRN